MKRLNIIRCRIGFFFLIQTIICNIGISQSVLVEDLESAIAFALTANPDYQNYLLNQKKAELEYKQARSHRFPTINGTFSGQRNIDLATTPLPGEIFNQPGETVNAQFGQEYNFNAGISISKQLINREASIQSEIASQNRAIISSETKIYEDLLIEQVSLYYYTGLLAKRAVEIGEKDLETASSIRQLSIEKFEQGIIEQVSLNGTRINENSVKQSLNSNRQLEMQCEIQLKKIFGLSPSDTLIWRSQLDYEIPNGIANNQFEPSAAVQNAELQVKKSDLQLKLSQAALWPTLQLNSYYGRQQFRDDLGLGFSSGDWTNYSYLSLNLNIPIFKGFSNRSKIKQSKFSQQIALQESQKTIQNQLLEDQLVISDYRLSRHDALLALEIFQLQEQNQQLSFQKYNEGLISLDSYLGVFEEYIKAENSYLNTLSKFYSYHSQILPRIK